MEVRMMTSASTSLSVKGQVVIPKKVREALGLRPGARLLVNVVGDEILLRRAPTGIGKRLYGIYRGTDLLRDLREERRRELEKGR